MLPISNISDLKHAIQRLEEAQKIEHALLKEQCLSTYENLKPFNFIKNKLKEVNTSSDFKDGLLVNTVGLAAGFASKALVVGGSENRFKKLLGTFVQLGISHLIAKNPETVKLITKNITSFLHTRKESDNKTREDHAT